MLSRLHRRLFAFHGNVEKRSDGVSGPSGRFSSARHTSLQAHKDTTSILVRISVW